MHIIQKKKEGGENIELHAANTIRFATTGNENDKNMNITIHINEAPIY